MGRALQKYLEGRHSHSYLHKQLTCAIVSQRMQVPYMLLNAQTSLCWWWDVSALFQGPLINIRGGQNRKRLSTAVKTE